MRTDNLPPDTDQTKLCLIQCTLEALVPIAIADLQRCGGPTDLDRERMHAFSEKLGGEGDTLLYQVRGKSGKIMGEFCKALAVMAFVPGGVTAFGLHFEATVQEG